MSISKCNFCLNRNPNWKIWLPFFCKEYFSFFYKNVLYFEILAEFLALHVNLRYFFIFVHCVMKLLFRHQRCEVKNVTIARWCIILFSSFKNRLFFGILKDFFLLYILLYLTSLSFVLVAEYSLYVVRNCFANIFKIEYKSLMEVYIFIGFFSILSSFFQLFDYSLYNIRYSFTVFYPIDMCSESFFLNSFIGLNWKWGYWKPFLRSMICYCFNYSHTYTFSSPFFVLVFTIYSFAWSPIRSGLICCWKSMSPSSKTWNH